METDETKQDRTAEYILDQIKAREAVFQQQIKEAQEANAKIIASSAASAAKFADQLEQIKDHALKAYESSVTDNV